LFRRPRNAVGEQIREDVMAKGQMRSNKEKKKPKADWNKKKKGAQPAGPQPSPFASSGKAQPQGWGGKKI
jgi:hypothetical protein